MRKITSQLCVQFRKRTSLHKPLLFASSRRYLNQFIHSMQMRMHSEKVAFATTIPAMCGRIALRILCSLEYPRLLELLGCGWTDSRTYHPPTTHLASFVYQFTNGTGRYAARTKSTIVSDPLSMSAAELDRGNRRCFSCRIFGSNFSWIIPSLFEMCFE